MAHLNTPEPDIIVNSMRVYINGLETPLTPAQIEEKRALERTLEARVRGHMDRMARGQSLLAQVSGQPAQSAPTASLGQPPSVDDAAQRQTNHWLVVEKRQNERPLDVTERANSCKAKYHSQRFCRFPSKQYAVKVHVVQDALGNDDSDPEFPADLKLRTVIDRRV
ncbi:hypothetical protein BGW41_002156 [Actinomortierella wolfii]|nr:hypothetical protein BGW41_002156 [Actinomortierella wolfii]